VHSGAFDPLEAAIEVAHQHGAWVHIDGAFGLWAAAAPSLRHLTTGLAGADSWTTDAHKTLNVPYDCGIAIVADPVAMRSTFGAHASYLIADDSGPGDPMEKVPEFSRRARGVPVWAALRSLGRSGVADLVEGLVRNAQALAEGIAAINGVQVVNDVVYTQVCLRFGDDARTRAVTAHLIADGTVWMSGSRWRDQDVLRISVSNWPGPAVALWRPAAPSQHPSDIRLTRPRSDHDVAERWRTEPHHATRSSVHARRIRGGETVP